MTDLHAACIEQLEEISGSAVDALRAVLERLDCGTKACASGCENHATIRSIAAALGVQS